MEPAQSFKPVLPGVFLQNPSGGTFWNTSSLTTQLGISRFLCVLGIILSLAIQKALLELTYTVKDRLKKQIPDKNISFYIFLLPYPMQLYYASSDFFRNLAGIQDIEKLEKKEDGGGKGKNWKDEWKDERGKRPVFEKEENYRKEEETGRNQTGK